MQRAVFEAMGLSRHEIRTGYGSWFDALRFGVPPMTGIGLGIDRFIAYILGEQKIRSVIAFPKTKQGNCPVMSPASAGS
jgi:aspartyl-tRNA synthetase